MGAMKTPGVYIVEKNAFPNSVVEVATAVPAFIGYAEKAKNGSMDLTNVPWRISSMAEFIAYFGEGPDPVFTLRKSGEANQEPKDTEKKDDQPEDLDKKDDQSKVKSDPTGGADVKWTPTYIRKNTLYYNLLLFYANGGGPCYIVSAGSYTDKLDADTMVKCIETLIKEQEPTMVVAPEAVNFSLDDCQKIQESMLKHCGYVMKSRFAIFDIHTGDKDRNHRDENFKDKNDIITTFRDRIGANFLNFGAAYYPWLNTGIIPESSITFDNFKDAESMKGLKDMLTINQAPDPSKEKEFNDLLEGLVLAGNYNNDEEKNNDLRKRKSLHETLFAISSKYKGLIKDMAKQINCLPVSAAMAGVYTMVDNTKGVWKAPANVSVASAVSPTVNISHEDQEELNVPLNGKAINAIRTFTGEGIKVWGARTLDGNSLDWRYINVRRTMIMLEESIKNAARAYVFDPNVANTWVSVKSMIGNFLTGIWKRGGLAGAIPDDAFSVHVGLGETMTPEDILEGIMRITVLVAITRPAEFIEITFQQQMQKS